MRDNKLMLTAVGVAFLLSAGGALADGSAKKSGELQALNKQISSLSDQIVVRQEGLETDLEKLLAQRRALLELEQRVTTLISDQEDKLVTQRMAIQEAEKQLESQKDHYLKQRRRLDELRASLGSDNTAKVENVAGSDTQNR